MNKELIIKDNTLYSVDENKVETKRENLDNIEEILLKENLIEALEKVKSELELYSNRFNKEKTVNKIELTIPYIISTLTPIITSYLKYMPEIINTKIGVMSKEKFIILFIISCLPISYKISKKWYKEYKEEQKSELGRIVAIDSCNRFILIEKKELEKLKQKSKSINISSLSIKNKSYTLENITNINSIISDIDACYTFGENYEEIFVYYLINGKLPSNILNNSSEENIKYLENIIHGIEGKIKIK